MYTMNPEHLPASPTPDKLNLWPFASHSMTRGRQQGTRFASSKITPLALIPGPWISKLSERPDRVITPHKEHLHLCHVILPDEPGKCVQDTLGAG